MTIASSTPRVLGTMVAYGFAELALADELALAVRLGAPQLEVLPEWRLEPDPCEFRHRVADSGLVLHSAHGCWGGQTIRAARVDLGQPDPHAHRAAIDDLRRCIDWLDRAGGRCLVVHPGGLSDPADAAARRDALGRGLLALAEHALGGGVTVCVENMPPGVHPGSRMADLADLVAEINQPRLGLALDTGHAHIAADLASETLAAGSWLRTTHVHDNDGSQDVHLPPGLGTIEWETWPQALDAVGYEGPIMLECIRHIRRHPQVIGASLQVTLRRITSRGAG